MKIFIIVLICLFILYLLITYLMFVFVSRKISNNILPMEKFVEEAIKPYEDIVKVGSDWMKEKFNKKEVEDVYITSDDNLKLHAYLLDNKNSKGTIILVHGYRSNPERDLYASTHEYYNMGYSLLLINQRTSEQSEGKYITYGIKECKDLIKWIKFINKRYPNKNVYLAGISMGASTCLMSLKYVTKEMNVKCCLVDCGYISAYKEVSYCLRHYFHLNGSLFMGMINTWCKLFGHFDLKSENTIDSLSKTNIPILFAHGLIDDFVPCKNSFINYEKYNGPKQLEIFDNATHGISYLTEHERYLNVLKKFLKEYGD